MSYQNVGTPRFYVDVFSYLNAIGLVDVIGSNSLGENLNVGLNPTNSNSYTMSENSNFFRTQFKEKIPLSFFQNKDNKTAYALLGHNCSSSNVNWNVKIRSNTTNSSEEDYGDEGYNEIINKGRGGSQYNEPDFDGFSIYEVEHGQKKALISAFDDSDIVAAQMGLLSVRDKVTNNLCEDGCRPIFEDLVI